MLGQDDRLAARAVDQYALRLGKGDLNEGDAGLAVRFDLLHHLASRVGWRDDLDRQRWDTDVRREVPFVRWREILVRDKRRGRSEHGIRVPAEAVSALPDGGDTGLLVLGQDDQGTC